VVPVLIWQKRFGVSLDRVNLDGGAISIGHPFGATGARQQLLHLAHALRAAGGGIGLSAMCGGGGIATATVASHPAE
jgi:acetyl-CoA acetyltransferase